MTDYNIIPMPPKKDWIRWLVIRNGFAQIKFSELRKIGKGLVPPKTDFDCFSKFFADESDLWIYEITYRKEKDNK